MLYQARGAGRQVLQEGPDFLAILAWHRGSEASQTVTRGTVLLAYRTVGGEGRTLLRARQAKALEGARRP